MLPITISALCADLPLGFALALSCVGAAWSGAVAQRKNLEAIPFAVAGFFFPLVAILVALSMRAKVQS